MNVVCLDAKVLMLVLKPRLFFSLFASTSCFLFYKVCVTNVKLYVPQPLCLFIGMYMLTTTAGR